MATISENLQTLNEAKLAIKTAIEAKGQNLTDVPFTDYAEKITAIVGGDSNPVIQPLTITENNTVYTAEDCDGYSPIEVNIERSMKKFCNAGGKFNQIDTIEDYRPILEYSDTENVTNMYGYFSNGTKIKHIPLLNTQKVTNISYMFAKCSVLESVPEFDFSKASSTQYTFNECKSLKVVPAFDLRNAYSMVAFFNSCTALEEVWIRNMRCDLQVGSGETWGHLLTLESLIHLIKELRLPPTNKTYTLTVGSVNLEKLANVYVRILDTTNTDDQALINELYPNDDLVGEKLPFVVLDEAPETPDDNTMLITDYIGEKRWQIA